MIIIPGSRSIYKLKRILSVAMLSRTRNFALSTTRALPSIRRVDSHIPPNHHKEIHMRANRGEENEVEKVEIQQVLEEPRDFWEVRP